MSDTCRWESVAERDYQPALLQFDAAGRLTAAEGNLARYGLAGVRAGMSADDFDFLVAMLPLTTPLDLPMVHTGSGVPRRVILEPLAAGTRVTLLDASREYELQHRVMQARNENRLFGERAVPPEVLTRTDLAVFERVGNGFRLLAPPPAWLRRLLPWQDAYSTGMLQSYLTFIEYFLPQAEAAWRSNGERVARAKWVEADDAGTEYEIEAAALAAESRRFLTLSSKPEEFAERRQILQKARLLRLSAERQTKDLEKRDVLLHAIVHDLIGPLGVISGTLAALGEDLTDPAKRRMTDIALLQCKRQEGMIRDTLDVYAADMARLDAFSTNPSSAPNVAGVLRDVMESMAQVFKSKQVALRIESPDVPPDTLVAGEASRLERVLANLLENALRYTPAGGAVLVRVKSQARAVTVEIADEGPGIEPMLIPRLFQKFSQGRERGGKIGLGLFFCRITVERWGGAIGAFNRPGGGAVFWFRLPKVMGQATHA
jgi:signal transduction histidine kinase